MTVARQIVPGSVYLITRRCSEQRHFLAPQGGTAQLFGYVLALAATRHRVRVLGCVQMSNHYHAVIHDPEGVLPAFTHHFHGLLARATNRLRRRTESFWDPQPPHYQELADGDAVMAAMVYVACNPVAAAAVREGRDWPGFRTSPSACLRGPLQFKRPRGFFTTHGPTPESATLEIHLPPTHAYLSDGDFAKLLEERVRLRENELQRELARVGRCFAGSRRAAALAWNGAARNAQRGEVRKPRRPTDVRGRGLASRLAAFRRLYRAALAILRDGVADVVFPGGTWRLARLLGVRTTASPPPAWQCSD